MCSSSFPASHHRTSRSEVAGAMEALERVRPATVCRRGVCPVRDDTRRELTLPLPVPPPPVAVAVASAAISHVPPPLPFSHVPRTGVVRPLAPFMFVASQRALLLLLLFRWSLSLVLFEFVTSPNLSGGIQITHQAVSGPNGR